MRRSHDGTTELLLEKLAAHPDGITAAFLAEWVWEDRPSHHAALTTCNKRLKLLAEAGCVERAGLVRGHLYHGAPTLRWRILPPGLERLSGFREEAEARAEALREAGRAAEHAAHRAELLDAVRAKYPPGARPPRHLRRDEARKLRDAGCTLRQIGDALGVTHEQARKDLLPMPATLRPRSGDGLEGTYVLNGLLAITAAGCTIYLTQSEGAVVARALTQFAEQGRCANEA